ncbi:MAG TPA: AsmA family protein [Spirochaetota bacterium]|nr:AsmA family protein [Spirochaetota bacterium]HPC42430.1 AsmA family protein [Spirochaetota bacterium]HQF06583.1 AsmA family protein [Spirochaetota bacterium]HQH96014.1 AsmA family protein [Spirochaetota bacterium]HQJ70332.1 AsmA family protein [Spirochaetota bacterium]
MKPAKTFKIFFIVLAALVLVLSAAVTLLVTFYPAERILALVTEKAESALGRKVLIKNIGYGIGGIVLDDVTVYESDERSPVLAGVEKADLRISLLSLLQMEIDFSSITLKKARCNIVFDDNNESNIGKLVTGLTKGGGSGVSAKISKIRLIDATVTLTNPPPYLAPLAGTYTADATIRIRKNVEISDCSVRLPQGRGSLQPELDIETGTGDFKISGAVKLENASLLWVYRWGKDVRLPYNVVNGTVKNLVITKTHVQGDVIATSTLLTAKKLISAAGFCRVDIPGRTVFIGRTQGGIDKSSFYIDNLLFTFDGNLIRFGFRNINSAVQDAAAVLRFLPAKLFGRVEGDLNYSGGLYNGNLRLTNCGYDPESGLVSDLHASLSITDNRFKQTGIPFKFYGNSCSLSIASTDASFSKLFINVGAETIVIDPEKNRFSRGDAPISIPKEISGIVNVGQLKYGRYRVSNIQLQYQLAGSTAGIPGFQFNFAEGTVSGSGAITMGQGAPRASLSLNFGRIMTQKAIDTNDKIRNRIFGVANGTSKFDFELSDKILETARGNIEFTIDSGKLVDTGIQNGLGLLLSELKYKLRDLEFNKIYGNMDIKGTTYLVNSFIFNSNNVRLKITGVFNDKLVASPLNITLEFTRAFIQDLPGLITIGLNKYLRGEWYIMPFTMSGDMMNGSNVRRVN